MKNTNTTKLSSKEACTLAHQIRRETGCSLAEAFKAAYNRNTTAATPKTHWTAEELNQLFSDKTAELIRKGYTIDLAGMAGHQGEIGKVIFKKNNTFYALVMESKSRCDGRYSDVYTIWFGKYTEDTSNMRPLDTWNTLWLNKFEASWKQEFVKITDNYYTTIEEAAVMNKKWTDRALNRATGWEEVSSKYNKVILAYIRKQKGYKSVKASEIVKITRIINDKHTYRVELSRQNKYGRNDRVEIKF